MYFPTVKHAIEWSMKTGQLRNVESARVSVRGQLRLLDEGELEELKGGSLFGKCVQFSCFEQKSFKIKVDRNFVITIVDCKLFLQPRVLCQ